jgi:hypothetical protein
MSRLPLTLKLGSEWLREAFSWGMLSQSFDEDLYLCPVYSN